MMGELRCPLCSKAVPTVAFLRSHLRSELSVTAFRCLLCSVRFLGLPEARAHFEADYATHPGEALALLEERDAEKEDRLSRLLRSAVKSEVGDAKSAHLCDASRTAKGNEEDVDHDGNRSLVMPPNNSEDENVTAETLERSKDTEDLSHGDDHISPGPAASWKRAEEAGMDASGPAHVSVYSTLGLSTQTMNSSNFIEPGLGSFAASDSLMEPSDFVEDVADEEVLEDSEESEVASTVNDSSSGIQSNESFAKSQGHSPRTPVRTEQASQSSDVPCGLCGKPVDKNQFKDHVYGRHMARHRFRCILCPFQCSRKAWMANHLKSKHNKDHPDLFLYEQEVSKEVDEMMKRCFGDTSQYSHKRLQCKSCKTMIPQKYRRQHTAVRHLRRVLQACRLCPFATPNHTPTVMAKHVRRKHAQAMDATNTKSYQKAHEKELDRLVIEMFGK